MRQPYLTQDQRDRREEAEAERYANLFETVHARHIRQYYENGGCGDFKPSHADVHDEVQRVLEAERRKREIGRALGDDD